MTRYAIYIVDQNGLAVFSRSAPTYEMAKSEMDDINRLCSKIKAVIIEVYAPHQKVDPYAEHFWEKEEATV
jgi:hypothetical protein